MTIHVVRIGGNIMETHAGAVPGVPGGSIAAIYGTNAKRVDRLCREHGGRVCQNFDAFLGHRPMVMMEVHRDCNWPTVSPPSSAVRTYWPRPEGSTLNSQAQSGTELSEVNHVHNPT
jgi:hypothetical protein